MLLEVFRMANSFSNGHKLGKNTAGLHGFGKFAKSGLFAKRFICQE